jgi:subtilisin-like proprotein convertase family protein
VLLLDGQTDPITGTLQPEGPVGDDPFMFEVSLGPGAPQLPLGVYEFTLLVRDLNSGVRRTVPHVLEVGISKIEVFPEGDFIAGGQGASAFDETRFYEVRNLRPVAADVVVTSDEPWIEINGSNAPAVFTLTNSGDFANVEVSFDEDAAGIDDGVLRGEVMFRNQTTGDEVVRAVILQIGGIPYEPEFTDDFDNQIDDFDTIVSTIEVPDNFCILDVDVEIDIDHPNQGDLRIELESPAGTRITLHDRTSEAQPGLVELFDATTNPADGPGSLDDFFGEGFSGTWTLEITDNRQSGEGVFNGWTLRLTPDQLLCPESAEQFFFDFGEDPLWQREGQWAFGTPTGSGSNPQDPTGGFDGPFIFGYNLSGDYANNLAPQHLTAGPFNLQGVENTRLSFYRRLAVEAPEFDRAAVEISTDGVTWSTVWENGRRIADNGWNRVSYSIAAFADDEPEVWIRWAMGPTDNLISLPGWNLDNVEITGTIAEPAACAADFDNSGVVDVLDLNALLPWFNQPVNPAPASIDVNGDGIINVLDLNQLLAGFNTVCP